MLFLDGLHLQLQAEVHVLYSSPIWFLNNNHILYRADGSKRLADNTLVALTLMIAESRTEEKDMMVKVVVNLINQSNEWRRGLWVKYFVLPPFGRI